MKALYFVSLLLFFVLSFFNTYAQPGSLDSSFGSNGIASFDFGIDYDDYDDFISATIQPDNKLIFLGTNAPNSATVFRLNEDGSPDNTFNSSGSSLVSFPEANTTNPRAFSLLPSGKIIIAGNITTTTGDKMAIACLLPDGQLDLSFGENGFVVPDELASYHVEESIALPGDKIVLTGTAGSAANYDLFIIRLLADGSFDSTFNNTGIKLFDLSSDDGGLTLALSPDNKLICGGLVNSLGALHTVIIRVNENGFADSTFNGTGILITNDFSGDVWPNYSKNWLQVQPDKKIIYALSSTGTAESEDFAVKRIMEDGTFDLSFGLNGITTVDFEGLDWAHSIALQPDGRIIVTGRSAEEYFYTGDFAMVCLFANGSVDPSFGTAGKVMLDITEESTDRPVTCLIQPDYKIVIGGNTIPTLFNIEMVLVRFQNSCFPAIPDFTFSLSGQDVQFLNTSVNTTSWQWDFGDGNTSALQHPAHTYSLPGIYDVCLTAINSCSADSICQIVNTISTSAQDGAVSNLQLSVFPNPFSSTVTISFSLKQQADLIVGLFDLQGRKIKTIVPLDSYGAEGNFSEGHHQLQFERENLSAGIYLLQLKSESGIQTQKIVIH